VTCGMALGGMVPLQLSATARSEMLEDWIRGWAATGRKLEVLEPRGWFTLGHRIGSCGWLPAPAAADRAIDQFCDALHKRLQLFSCIHHPPFDDKQIEETNTEGDGCVFCFEGR
jgi:hypothetical protein